MASYFALISMTVVAGVYRRRSSLAIGAGNTATLRLGCLDDEFQVGDIGRDVVQGEGHRGTGDDRSGGSIGYRPQILTVFNQIDIKIFNSIILIVYPFLGII